MNRHESDVTLQENCTVEVCSSSYFEKIKKKKKLLITYSMLGLLGSENVCVDFALNGQQSPFQCDGLLTDSIREHGN